MYCVLLVILLTGIGSNVHGYFVNPYFNRDLLHKPTPLAKEERPFGSSFGNSGSVDKSEIPKDVLSSSSCRYLVENGYLSPTAKNHNSLKTLCATTFHNYAPTCTPQALGLENGDIPDYSITASSFDESLYRPEQGRLHYKGGSEGRAPAWEPSKPQMFEWIQVDLGKEMTVTGVATQGNGKRELNEWVTTYNLMYSNDGENFEDYENGRVFDGNNDRDSVKKNRVDPPIQARFIRLRTTSWYNWNALRMELYGCSQDVLSNAQPINDTCAGRPLGMQSGAIPDSSITASSFYHSQYPPHEARLNNRYKSRLASGSWCVRETTDSWIQADLGTVTEVTGIATQGKVNPHVASAYTKSYKLKYSNDGKVFTEYLKGVVLVGNSDWDTVVKNDLVPVINARYIRIYPQTWHEHLSLRVELYGCKTGNLLES